MSSICCQVAFSANWAILQVALGFVLFFPCTANFNQLRTGHCSNLPQNRCQVSPSCRLAKNYPEALENRTCRSKFGIKHWNIQKYQDNTRNIQSICIIFHSSQSKLWWKMMAWSDWAALPLQRVDMMLALATKWHPGAAKDLEKDMDCSLLHILWESFQLGILVFTRGWPYSISTHLLYFTFPAFSQLRELPRSERWLQLPSVGLLQLHRDAEVVAHDAWWHHKSTPYSIVLCMHVHTIHACMWTVCTYKSIYTRDITWYVYIYMHYIHIRNAHIRIHTNLCQ